ncbi:MAG: NADH-quinone oxidoreductase subunit NuoE [Deltaproteobacteria bacterium]|nr:NADH-quinone oxidoreductase subunit NuoE [Deltaproteobacteria bacterium]
MLQGAALNYRKIEDEEFGAEEQEFTAEELAAVDDIINRYQDKPGSLIPVLEEIQETIGYLPISIQKRVALGLKIPFAEVYGVVTFYSFFTMQPKGRHTIRVCLGTACYVRGGKKILGDLTKTIKVAPGETTADKRFSLETVRCLGACGLAPTMIIDTDTFRQVKASNLPDLIKDYE